MAELEIKCEGAAPFSYISIATQKDGLTWRKTEATKLVKEVLKQDDKKCSRVVEVRNGFV